MTGNNRLDHYLADPRDVRVLNGDIHHGNICQFPRGWLPFDPKGLVGERTNDLANKLCYPPITVFVHNETRLLTNAGILADMLEIDLQRVLEFTFAYACLSASWSLNRDEEKMAKWALGVARIVKPHITL